MPGGARRELGALDQRHIPPTFFRQVIERADSDHAATDDQNPNMRLHEHLSIWSLDPAALTPARWPARPRQETATRRPRRSAPPRDGTSARPCATAPLLPSPARYAYTYRWGRHSHRDRAGSLPTGAWPPADRPGRRQPGDGPHPRASAAGARGPARASPRVPHLRLWAPPAATHRGRARAPHARPARPPGMPARGWRRQLQLPPRVA